MLRASARRLLAASRSGTRRFPASGHLQHRCVATQPRTDDTDDASQHHLIYESDQSFKFKGLSAFGGVYATCWLGYVAADVFLLDPSGAIASNSGIVGFIGVSSVAGGACAIRMLASKTVGRLVINYKPKSAPTLEVTTYSVAGSERVDEAMLGDIIPRSSPTDTSRLKTFLLPQDETRAYLVMVDPESVKDPQSFAKIVSGVASGGDGDDRQMREVRRRRRRKKRRGG